MLKLHVQHGRNRPSIFDLPDILGRENAVQELGDQIETLIDFLDGITGDPDGDVCEAGEDLGTGHAARYKMGFEGDEPLADSCGEDADADDPGYTEWHTRGRNKLARGAYEIGGNHEDDETDDIGEDDDPPEDSDPDHGIEDQLEGPEDSDAGVDIRPISDPLAYRQQVRRIWATRCDPVYRKPSPLRPYATRWSGPVSYRLRHDDYVPPASRLLNDRGMPETAP